MTHENFSKEAFVRIASDRVFGLVLCVAFAIPALLSRLHGKPVIAWPLAVSAAFLILALLVPSILHPLNLFWTRLGLLISKVTTPLVTGLIFVLVFVPTGLIARVFGKIPLRLKGDPGVETYWVSKQLSEPPAKSMRNQF
jgi:hypothetical protein